MRFAYPVDLQPDEGAVAVSFRDFPEAHTQGETIADALVQAVDCLDEAVAARIMDGEDVPLPSDPLEGQYLVVLPSRTAAKAALHLTMRHAGVNRVQLASALRCDEKHVRRLLDPAHRSDLDQLERALALLGKRIIVEVRDAA